MNSYRYDGKLDSLSKLIENQKNEFKSIKDKTLLITPDLFQLKNQFSENYNIIIQDLTQIINIIENLNKEKEVKDDKLTNEDEDDNPAARIPKMFKLQRNEFSMQNADKPEYEYFKDGLYEMRNEDLCLIGDKPVGVTIQSWRLYFPIQDNFKFGGCCGFGLISLDDPNSQKNIKNQTGKNPLFCGCCNGGWSNAQVQSKSGAMQSKLIGNRTFRFEYKKDDNKFSVYDPNGELFCDYDMNKYEFKENIVFVVTSNGTPKFSFFLLEG